MSLKQMMDAAEARANVQRKRKWELSCTQDQAQQKNLGWGGRALLGRWKGNYTLASPWAHCAHCPVSTPRFGRVCPAVYWTNLKT